MKSPKAGRAACGKCLFQRLCSLSMAMKILRVSVFRLNMTVLRDTWLVTPRKLDFHEKFAVNVKDKLVGAKTVE